MAFKEVCFLTNIVSAVTLLLFSWFFINYLKVYSLERTSVTFKFHNSLTTYLCFQSTTEAHLIFKDFDIWILTSLNGFWLFWFSTSCHWCQMKCSQWFLCCYNPLILKFMNKCQFNLNYSYFIFNSSYVHPPSNKLNTIFLFS